MINHNQKGITLVVVLLMITVFSILGMSVIGYTISNTKQIDKSESVMQSTDVAEMGVIHYKNAFIQNANKVLSELIDINGINTNRYLTKEAKEQALYDFLKDENNQEKFKVIFNSETPQTHNLIYSFENQIADFDHEKNEIKVTFDTKGQYKQKKQETITTTIVLNVKSIFEKGSNSGDDGGNENDNTLPTMVVPRPDGLINCEIKNSNNLVCGSTTYNLSIQNLKLPNFYLNGDGVFNNLQVEKDTIIYIVGKADFNGITGGINKDNYIYISGDATFTNIMNGIDMNNKIFIGGNATFNDEGMNFKKESSICVGGSILGKSFKKDSFGHYPEGVYSFKDDPSMYIEAVKSNKCPPIENEEVPGKGDNNLVTNPQLINSFSLISDIKYN
jgi:hypothetical protein